MAFTEFYCTNLGSNLNGGSLSNGAEPGPNAVFTNTNGNWSTTTNNFKVTTGVNPSLTITVGDFASIYNDGASTGVYLARVTAVQNAVNGNISLSSTAAVGTAPTTSATARTIKVGGALKGPNGADGFPLTISGGTFANATNSSTDGVRINFKNTASYLPTSLVTVSASLASCTMQGYSSSPGDGGKATIDGSTNVIGLVSDPANFTSWIDWIFVSSAASGNVNNFALAGVGQRAIRVVSHGARASGIVTTQSGVGGAMLIECEAYDCNKFGNVGRGGIDIFSGAGATLVRCTSHDNTGSNGNGFTTGVAATCFFNCISWNNGGNGFAHKNGTSSSGGFQAFVNCDTYNNTGDGINIAADSVASLFWIESCNFIKNGGKGVNNTASNGQFTQGFVYNCGYGSGTQVNVGGDATLGALIETGKLTYASGITPYSAPTTGNFSIILAAAKNLGRGFFMETDGTNTGTVGYPDIGAAQASAFQRSFTFSG